MSRLIKYFATTKFTGKRNPCGEIGQKADDCSERSDLAGKAQDKPNGGKDNTSKKSDLAEKAQDEPNTGKDSAPNKKDKR